jgi:hypothetical protein
MIQDGKMTQKEAISILKKNFKKKKWLVLLKTYLTGVKSF